MVCVEATRQGVGAKTSVERRYYLSSLDGRDVQVMLGWVRGHWSVENALHWCLDMGFCEDESRLRKGYGAENVSRLRRGSLNLLKAERTVKAGIQGKRLKCGWNHDYLIRVLTGS